MIQDVKIIYLCTPDRQVLYALNGVRTETVELHKQVKDYSELSFDVDRFIVVDGQQVVSAGYEDLKAYMYLFIDEIGYFQIQAPTQQYDGNEEYKTVTAYSAEKEFEDKDWLGFKVNTGESDSLEYLASNNVNELGFAKNYVTVVNANKELSLLDIILSKMSFWSIGEFDRIMEILKVPNISLENSNLYAILTTEVGPRLGILFTFDFLHCKINAHSRNALDIDTGIFIGFRNLAKSVNISVNEDSIFTRFRIRGDNDLTIRDWNYDDERYDDLSYFLGEPYMEESLAQKIRDYYAFRDANRETYANLSKEVTSLNEKIIDKKYKTPSDESYWKNWSNMNEEGLNENLGYYRSLLESLQIAIDDRSNSEKYINYGTEAQQYNPVKKNGQVDHDWYLNKYYAVIDQYGGYYTYIEIINYIIPYIELALDNLNKPNREKRKPENDATENWELYGLIELQGKLEEYEDKLISLSDFKKPWSELAEEEYGKVKYANEDNYNQAGHNMYVHYENAIGNNTTPGTIKYKLKQLQDELNALQQQYNVKNQERLNWVELMKLGCQKSAIGTAKTRIVFFTENEINLITNLYHDTDYTNSNILTTSIDTAYTTIDREKELFDDAKDKLSEVSQPQYNFTVDLDNLLRIPEFKAWHDDFDLLSFIRVGIRDDYSVKLRIMGYTYNPCEIDPNLSIEFSSMITNSSGRSDLTQLLNTENNRGSKNSISIGIGNSKSDQEYVSSLLNVLTKNSIFTQAVGGIAGGITGPVDPITINSMIADYLGITQLEPGVIHVKNIKGERADFEEMFTEYLGAKVIVSQLVNAEEGIIDNLAAKVITVGEEGITKITEDTISTANIRADQIDVAEVLRIGTDTITTIAEGTITTDNVIAKLVEAEKGDFDGLDVNSAFIQHLNSGVIEATKVTGEQIVAGLVELDNADDFSLLADTAFIDYLESNLVVAHAVQADEIEASLANIDIVNSELITSESAFFKSLQTFTSTSATTVINDAYIKEAVAGKITVSDLAASDITISDNMRILSENGQLIMNGSALQIMGKDSQGNDYVGVQLGYATNNQPSLILRNEQGATIIDPSGITSDAIADGLIINNMISQGTISEDRLAFNVMKQGDTVSIEQIYTGNGKFGVEYTEFKDSTNNYIKNLRSDLDDISTYDLFIETPNGTNLRGNNITLTAKLFKNNIDVTDEWDAEYFTWTRQSKDADGDTQWNIRHASGTKTIIITGDDVHINANFRCKFEVDGETIATT